jgi:hypothetical protein
MKPRIYLLLFSLFFLVNGCSEGGIGGTGGIIPAASPGAASAVVSVVVSGSANKGPYADTAPVTSRMISDSGALSSETVSGVMAAGLYGGYTIEIATETTQLAQISGAYFSENLGVTDALATLQGVVLAGSSSANINVATHLIHLRVINLMSDGMAAAVAIDSAEAELLLELSRLLPSPSNAITFSNLVLLNAQPESINPEGNAWLLALSSILEKSALIVDVSAGSTSMESRSVEDILTTLAADLESDGTLFDENLAGLLDARAQINPDLIHRNLLFLDESLRESILLASGEVSAEDLDDYACGVFQNEIKCAGIGVADMNLFIDTDADGIVNALDDDDDNDGIEDSMDPTPYG